MQDKKIKERKRTGVCEGGSFSERSSSLALPPEERLAFGLAASALLVPPERLVRGPVAWLWSRRLTEPPRPCEMGERTPPPAYGGHLPFQGRLYRKRRQKAPSAEGTVSRRDHHHAIGNHTILSGGTKSAEKHNLNASRSSGERGLGGEGLLSEKPPLPQNLPTLMPPLHGRGGSVSRRDHNVFARNSAHAAWARKSEGKAKPIPSYSSGGGPGEGLLLEKPPPPEFFPPSQILSCVPLRSLVR